MNIRQIYFISFISNNSQIILFIQNNNYYFLNLYIFIHICMYFIYRRSGIIQSYLKKNEKKKFREKCN
jgi:hypothetical protein